MTFKISQIIWPALAALGVVSPVMAAPLSQDAITPGQKSVAAAIDTAPSGTLATAVSAVPTAEGRSDALGQLSTRAFVNMPRATIDSMDFADRQMRSYLAARRTEAAVSGPFAQFTGLASLRLTFDGAARVNIYDAGVDRERSKVRSAALRFNADITPMPDLIVGVTAGVDAMDIRLDPVRRPRSTQFNTYVGPYASFARGGFYIDGAVGYNFSDYSLRRQVGFGSFTDKLVSKAEGDGWSASTEAGAMLRYRGVRLQPHIGVAYRYADVAPFQENGGAAALQVNSFNIKSVRGVLGVRASVDVQRGKWTLRPSFDAQWQHEFRNRPESRIDARFVTGPSSVMMTADSRFSRNAANVGVGLTATPDNRFYVRAAYNAHIAAGRHSHAGSLTLSRRF